MVTLWMWGARISLVVGFAATLVSMVIGGTVGVLAGYFGGKTDTVLMRITDYFLVIPDVPLMIVVAAIWGPSLFHIVIVIGILLWTGTARVIRAQVKSVRERVYVKRARALGAGHARIVLRHVLPQVAPLLIANTVLTVAVAVFDETALSFLGLGDPSRISLGKVIENAFQRAAISSGAWWAIVPPGVCVTVVILACTMVGQSMEDALNPRLRVGHLSVRRFRLRPLPGDWPDQAARHLIGTQFQVWTEYIPDGRALDYMTFPRACAFAEVAWHGVPAAWTGGEEAEEAGLRQYRGQLRRARFQEAGVRRRVEAGAECEEIGRHYQQRHASRCGRSEERAALPAQRATLQSYLAAITLPPDARGLEVGCGSGRGCPCRRRTMRLRAVCMCGPPAPTMRHLSGSAI